MLCRTYRWNLFPFTLLRFQNDPKSSARLLFSSELVNFSAVAFRRSALGRWTETHARPAFLSDLEPQFTAQFAFAVQRLSYRRRATYVVQEEDFHFEIATLGPDL